ncbi:MAG: DNA polymerase I [Actinomycetota bacterium]
MAKLLLIDGHSLAYRAFYALPADMATRTGTVTNAVFGFASMLAKVLTDERPDFVAVAFDPPGGSAVRKELDPAYKAGRRETPDLFIAQLPLIREVVDALGLRAVEVSGVEADDVIATLATAAAASGIDAVVVTGDRDSYQLVSDPHVRVLYNKRGVSDYVLYDEAGIAERCLGVTPAQYLDYASLRGDTSDNLPGVPGIGEKTAAKLITTYGHLEGIFEHLDELPPKQRANLGEARDRVLLNREMSRLDRNVDLGGLEPEGLAPTVIDADRLRNLCNQLEFRALLPRLLAAVGDPAIGTAPSAPEVDVVIARDAAAAGSAFSAAAGISPRAVEARWAGSPGRSAVLGLGIAAGGVVTYVDGDLLADAAVRAALANALAVPGVLAHGAKELMHGLDDPIEGLSGDTALMAYLLDPADGRYDLAELVLRHVGTELVSADAAEGTLDLDGSARSGATGRRAAVLGELAEALTEGLASRELAGLYAEVEQPLIGILAEMERTGVRVDVAFLEELGRELGAECRRLEAEMHGHAGEPFNVNSTPQLRKVLFERLGLTPVKKTKTGPSTDAESLQKLLGAHPIVETLLRYREVEKLRSTYADALPPLVGADGRIHATFNQLATATGRISSEAPNLQNIPVRTSTGRELRRAFVADEGCGLLTADYSQIELRVLAHLADDPGLVDAFARGADIHAATAAKVFGIAEDAVADHQRRFAKVVNYGLAYGMGAYGLAQRLDVPVDEGQAILDSYFAAFPRIDAYMHESIRDAREHGFTTTLLGRRRLLPELTSDNFRIRQMGERMAQNAPVQGTAADIFKLAMIHTRRALADHGLASRMVLTVHDELVLEVPLGERDAATEVVRGAMEGAMELRVPLVVDIGFGATWADAK